MKIPRKWIRKEANHTISLCQTYIPPTISWDTKLHSAYRTPSNHFWNIFQKVYFAGYNLIFKYFEVWSVLFAKGKSYFWFFRIQNSIVFSVQLSFWPFTLLIQYLLYYYIVWCTTLLSEQLSFLYTLSGWTILIPLRSILGLTAAILGIDRWILDWTPVDLRMP